MATSRPQSFTYLFVPGSRPERFDKALASGADRIILDLEDAVAPAEKQAALAAIAQWLSKLQSDRERVLVRINAVSTPWFEEDLAMLARHQPCGAMLSKCETAADLVVVRSVLSPSAELVALIETAKGLARLQAIAEYSGVSRLAMGSLDLMAELDVPSNSPTLMVAAAQLVLASRACDLPQPIAGVTPALNAEQVQRDMAEALQIGFGAKMCIHPMQLQPVRNALKPSADELAWAQRVMQAWQASLATGTAAGAIQVDGKMVDRPVVLRAEQVLHKAAI
jgi:citrate lyase subunit beta/citryl-CoA lyase